MSTDPLLIHLWLSALRAIGGFDLTIAIRDVELVYRCRAARAGVDCRA